MKRPNFTDQEVELLMIKVTRALLFFFLHLKLALYLISF